MDEVDQKKTTDVLYPHLMDRIIPEKFVRKAEIELFEKPESVEIKTEDVRKLIRKDKGMKEEWFTDDDILMYLRSRKFDAQKAFAYMKKMSSFVRKHRKYFDHIDIEILNEVVESGIFEVLPRRDSGGCSVGIVRFGRWDPSKISVSEFLHCGILMTMIAITEPMTQINGVKLIADFNCNPMKYVRYVTPFNGYFLYHLMWNCMPMRLKAIHAINPTYLTKVILALIKTMATEKLKKRIMIHDEIDEVFTHISQYVVPIEFGGTLPDGENTKMMWSKNLSWPGYVTAILQDNT